MLIFWPILVWLWSFVRSGQAVDCYTCSVDFRSEPFDHDNPCLFPPKDHKGETKCNAESKYCHGIVTRVNRVFVQIQRTCEVDCQQYCTEKGFGIETSECHYCCNDTDERKASCGYQGYKTGGAPLLAQTHLLSLFAYSWLWLIAYDCAFHRRSNFRINA